MPVSVDPSFIHGSNAVFIAELYTRYLTDPTSVDESWQRFFADLRDDPTDLRADLRGPSWARRGNSVITGRDSGERPAASGTGRDHGDGGRPRAGLSDHEVRARTLDSIRALMMIRAYRIRGHLKANLDPLNLTPERHHAELDYRTYGFGEDDLDREIFIDNVLGLEQASLRTILAVLKETYAGSIGVEFMHMQDPEQKSWVQRRIESIRNQTQFTERGKRAILERLTEAEGFEKFLQLKYTGTKRFGLEGGESLIPALEQILKRGSQTGLQEVVLGMAHRGRLNVLANIMHKPFRAIFSEFQGNPANPEDVQGSGDVKYHLGTSADRVFDGENVHLSLVANPSHLEAVNPVVMGKVRSKQNQLGRGSEGKVLGLLLHGDAAFAGQGVVSECFSMAQLKGYDTGGTMHVVINNQIGFTTSPQYARSGTYCTDVALSMKVPIFHVNGDDPEAVVHVARIATEYRQTFHTDVVLDIVCYRRHGHNEGDEPAFTQPIMYRRIAQQPTTRQIYADQLVREGVLSEKEAQRMVAAFEARLDGDFEAAKSYRVNKADWLEGHWSGLSRSIGEAELQEEATDVDLEDLQVVGRAITTAPDGFNLNSKIDRQLKAKARMLETGVDIDWATAEALAFGTLLKEGTRVRLSGQDSGRGTFSQRHAVLVDQETEARHIPLANVTPGQAPFEILDSPLAEFSVLGYEYGYSLNDPRALVLWEAQFGDFANGAQVVFDQFVASAESKWLRMSGLVCLLPHGYEGQGPEHSSARLERYLQLCAEDNMQVCNLTTPANYFHALRRQIHRNFRKPLIIMTPKSLLRHKRCVSTLESFGPGSRFHRVIAESGALAPDAKIRRVILCSGKVAYDLMAGREDRGIDDVAVIRVEQLYPWPKQTLLEELRRYPNADLVWCQEEPANMGAWLFVLPRLEFILQEVKMAATHPVCVARAPSASTATGLMARHKDEQETLMDRALTWAGADIPQPFQRLTDLGSKQPAAGRPRAAAQ